MGRQFVSSLILTAIAVFVVGCQGGGGEAKYTGGDSGEATGKTNEDATKAQPQRGGQG